VAFIETRKKIFSVLLASSLSGMGNLACLAADSGAGPAVPLWQEQAAANCAQLNTSALAEDSPLLAFANIAPAKATAPQTIVQDQDSDTFVDPAETDLGDGKTILKSPLLIAAADPSSAAPPVGGYVLSGGAQATPDECPDRIDQLSRQILLKEIELERFNLHYTREVAVQGRWKGWRYAGFQEVNAGMGLTGAIISTAYRGARLNDAGKIKPCIQESANYIPMIGSYIGAGAAAMEFGINEYHDLVARHRGYSPAESIRKVGAIKADIDKMMAERDALTKIEASSPTLSGQTEIDIAEGKVLQDMLEQSLEEFERFHVGARKLLAFQQMQFFFDFSKYITNSLGYNFGYLTLHRHHRRYNGNAGVLFITSGALTVFGPMVSRVFAKGVGEITRHNARAVTASACKSPVSTLQADLANLDRLAKQTRISNASERCLAREGHYTEHQNTYVDEIRAAEKAKGKAVLTATQNIGAAVYVGGTKIASGVEFTVVGFNHHYRAKTERANHVTNDNLFVASVIAIPSSAFSMLDTLRIQVQGEIARKKLAAKGQLPGQLVAKRLAQLDDMEKKIKAIR
jgi:hypothetical protein